MFGGGNKIKLEDTLFQKVKVAAGILGCTIEEFVERTLERETEQVMAQTSSQQASQAEVEEIANRLKGLGYLE
jgi:Cdc6-like AAA superfamily ATPase